MSLFQELNADPAEVVGLFPSLVPEDLRAQFKYPVNIPKLGTGVGPLGTAGLEVRAWNCWGGVGGWGVSASALARQAG